MKDQILILNEKEFNNISKQIESGKSIKINGSWWDCTQVDNSVHQETDAINVTFELYLAPNQHPPRMRGFDLQI